MHGKIPFVSITAFTNPYIYEIYRLPYQLLTIALRCLWYGDKYKEDDMEISTQLKALAAISSICLYLHKLINCIYDGVLPKIYFSFNFNSFFVPVLPSNYLSS